MNKLKKLLKSAGILIALLILSPRIGHATTIDLTSGAAGDGFINGAFYEWIDASSTGTGVIDSFVRLDNNPTEEGYNTSGRPLTSWPDVNTSPTFTHDLTLGSIPIVNINGTDYREFLLDINQNGCPRSKPDCTDPLLSLDQLKIYEGTTGGLTTTTLSDLGALVYNMDATSNSEVDLNFRLNPGSGAGDMFAYIPNSLFTGSSSDFIYLYSQFGSTYPSNDGFEEWAVRKCDTPGVTCTNTPPTNLVPEPASMLLFSTGLLGAFIRRKRS